MANLQQLFWKDNTGIYKITCTRNKKIYIGSAVNLVNRKRQHFQGLRRNAHKNRHLQFAFNSYGEAAFRFEVIEYVYSRENLITREQYWLDKTQCYDRQKGFNVCKIADSHLGVKRSEEFKEKIRQHNMNRSEEVKLRVIEAVKKANTGSTPHNKGAKVPFELRGKPNLGKKFPNRKFTKEGYSKICESNRRPRGEAYLKKRSFISSKSYYFTSPEGADIKIENMSEFCDKIGLNKSRMYQVAKGNEPHHKGWILDENCN